MHHIKGEYDICKSLRSLQHQMERSEHWRMSSCVVSNAVDYIRHLEKDIIKYYDPLKAKQPKTKTA